MVIPLRAYVSMYILLDRSFGLLYMSLILQSLVFLISFSFPYIMQPYRSLEGWTSSHTSTILDV